MASFEWSQHQRSALSRGILLVYIVFLDHFDILMMAAQDPKQTFKFNLRQIFKMEMELLEEEISEQIDQHGQLMIN